MSLTESQLKAVEPKAASKAVIAQAGSGKTRVLVEHVSRLIQSGVPPHRICAFTFTEKAALEMQQRLGKTLPPEQVANTFIGTIHGFCMGLLKKYGLVLGLDPTFDITLPHEYDLDKDKNIRQLLKAKINGPQHIAATLAKRFGFENTVSLLSTLIDDTSFHFIQAPQASDTNTEEDDLLIFAKSVYDFLLKSRLKKARLNFSDLEILATHLLSHHADIRKTLVSRYSHILVDEFQDTNPVQSELVDLLHSPGTNHLFIVGDPRQSIYRFRKADVKLFFRHMRLITKSGGDVIELAETFRLTPKLVELVNTVCQKLFEESLSSGEAASQPDSFSFSPMIAGKKVGTPGEVHLFVWGDEKNSVHEIRTSEAETIAQTLEKFRDNPDELARSAVLFRTNRPMVYFEQALRKRGIATVSQPSTELFKIPLLRDLVHVLTYVAGQTDPITQAGILRSVFFDFSNEFIESVLKAHLTSFKAPFELGLFTDHSDLKEWQKLNLLLDHWTGEAPLINAEYLLDSICRRLHIEKIIRTMNDVAEKHELITGLDYLKELVTALLPLPLNEVVDRLKQTQNWGLENAADSTENKRGVRLLTIHGSKGLEFRRVFLPELHNARTGNHSSDYFLDEEKGLSIKTENITGKKGLKVDLTEPAAFASFKQDDQWAEREELKRLLYVALTRAEEEIYLFLKDPLKKKIKWNQSKNPGEWIWALTENFRNECFIHPMTSTSPQAAEQKTSSSEHKLIYLEQDRIKTADISIKPVYTVSQIETHLRCQKEYELKYVLGVDPVDTGVFDISKDHQQDTDYLPSSQWGTLVHEVMQFLDFENLSNEDTVIRQALQNQHIVDHKNDVSQRLKTLVHTLVTDNATNTLLKSETSNDFRETEFFVDLGNFYLKGTLDRLYKTPKGYKIVDYKTDLIKDDKKKLSLRLESYQLQLKLYALAISKLNKESLVEGSLLFTDGPLVFDYVFDPKILQEAESLLGTIHEKLAVKTSPSNPAFEYPSAEKAKELCPRCPYFKDNYCGIKNSR